MFAARLQNGALNVGFLLRSAIVRGQLLPKRGAEGVEKWGEKGHCKISVQGFGMLQNERALGTRSGPDADARADS